MMTNRRSNSGAIAVFALDSCRRDLIWGALQQDWAGELISAKPIVEQLISHGLSPSHPAVIGSAVSRLEQQYWTGPLCDLPAGVDQLGVEHPLIIGIGDVFSQAVPVANRWSSTVSGSDPFERIKRSA